MKVLLTHLRLLVSNYKDSFVFYRDILGFEVNWGDENSEYAEFNTGSIPLAVLRKEYMAGIVSNKEQYPSVASDEKNCLVFAVDNVDEVYQHLKEHNVIVISPPQDRLEWGIRTAHFHDPDGNLIEIYTNLGIVG